MKGKVMKKRVLNKAQTSNKLKLKATKRPKFEKEEENVDFDENESEEEVLPTSNLISKKNGKQVKLTNNKKKKNQVNEDSEEEEDEEMSVNSEDEDEEDIEMEENSEEGEEEDDDDEEELNEEEDDDDEDVIGKDEVSKHKHDLEKLKDTDPEFYKFLKENDERLLNFDVSDDENSDSEAEENDEDQRHVPNEDELEKGSDESDFEAEDGETIRDKRTITLKMLKQWRIDLANDKSNKTITQVIRAFRAALQTVAAEGGPADGEKDDEVTHYKVEGSAVFNGVITLCVLELGPAMRRFLNLKTGSQLAHKSKKFAKLKSFLRGYFYDLLKLLGSVTSTNILTVLLKHVHYMTSFLTSFPPIVKPFLKKLIKLWSISEESVRVIAFLCILRITHKNQKMLLNDVLKWMNLAYVQNTKFVSIKTLPNINFMRRSLVEMYSLDLGVAYEQMFLYTRQMAILVRNAIMAHTKENLQSVYNWQFINNLKLWSNLLSSNSDKDQLKPLIYPFIQLCFGTVNLVPTTQFYPLRFHVIQILIDLSKETQVFVNPAHLLLEIFDNYDFNKPHQKASMKPVNFTSILRASKSQMNESGFKDTLIETIYCQLLDFLSLHCTKLAFPELSLLIIIALKKFISGCKKHSFTNKMKQLVERIEQTSNVINNYRKSLSCNLKDGNEIERVERDLNEKGTPLLDFYNNWKKFSLAKKRKQATEADEINEHKLPTLKKKSKSRNNDDKGEEEEGPVTLFPSDDDSDGDEEMDIEKKSIQAKARGKRGQKINNNKKTKSSSSKSNSNSHKNGKGNYSEGFENDVVEDLNFNDW